MPIDDAAQLAAMNTGIAEATSAAAPATPAGEPAAASQEGSNHEADSQATADEGVEGGEQGDGEGGSPAGEPAVGAEGEPAGEPGAPSAGGEDQAAAGPAKPAAPAPELTPEQKLEKALNDPLPNALKAGTKERIQLLSSKVRETTTKLDEMTRDRNDMLQAVIDTGASPQQYSGMLGYLRLVNGGPSEREQALQMMQQEVAALAISLGKVVPGVNFLEGHNDLIAEVGSGRLSNERAMEIAASRARQAYEARTASENSQRQRVDANSQRAIAAGKAALTAVEAELRSDQNYTAKKAILVTALKPVFATIPPAQWADTFRRAYAALPAPAPAAVPPTPTPTPSPQAGTKPNGGGGNTPLRASNPAGSAAAPPSSMLEALNFGISSRG